MTSHISNQEMRPDFRETLEHHLKAIQGRDLAAFRDTLPTDECQVVQSDGKLLRTAREVVAAHADWFGDPHWSIGFEEINVIERRDMGLALLRLTYSSRDDFSPGNFRTQHSLLSLAFIKEDDRWVMIHDQNTPIEG